MLLGYKIHRLAGKITSQPCSKSLICYTSRCQQDLCSYSVCWCCHLYGLGFLANFEEFRNSRQQNKSTQSAGPPPSSPSLNKTQSAQIIVNQTGRSVPVWQQGYVKLAMQLFDV